MGNRTYATCLVAAGVLLLVGPWAAAADINNTVIRLGVNNDGSLVATPTQAPMATSGPLAWPLLGVRLMATNLDGASPALPVEGWGVGDLTSNQWGGASAGSPTSLTATTFSNTATTALSTTTAAGILRVTHDFHPSTNPNLYEITVTVQNTSAAPVNARYRRTVDWDIEPTELNEFVTIQGATLPGVLSFTNSGFGTQNPLVPAAGANGNVINSGPSDLGATLTLDLGTLAPGASTVFQLYYGAAVDRAAAVTVVTAMGINVYSLGQPNNAAGTPNTFIFGAKAASPAAGVTITQSAGSTNVTEGGVTDTYTVVLTTAPTANVTITVNPGTQATVAPTTLTFTPANWNTAQTVTVTAVDDAAVEGPHTATITHTAASTDTAYNAIAIASVTANITDNDAAGPGVTVTQSGGSTSVAEGGTTDTYTVVLNTAPTANVTVTINPGTQASVAPATLTFTTANWNTAQTVTVTAIDDAAVEGAHSATITHTAASTDAGYNAIAIASVTAAITDNDGTPVTPSGPEGTYKGGSGPGGDEGSFGFGGRSRWSALAGPFDQGNGSRLVLNSAHRSRSTLSAAEDGRQVPTWAWAVSGVLLALAAAIVIAKHA